jgi:hypothetical protein
MENSFIDRCIRGESVPEEIDDCVDMWHEGKAGCRLELHEFLGMTWDEYCSWQANNLHRTGFSLFVPRESAVLIRFPSAFPSVLYMMNDDEVPVPPRPSSGFYPLSLRFSLRSVCTE